MFSKGNCVINIPKILETYSESELISFIGGNNVQAYSTMFDVPPKKEHLIIAVHILCGYKLVSRTLERQQFIERIPLEMIREVTENFVAVIADNEKLGPNVNFYDSLLELSDQFPKEFVAFCGYASVLEVAEQSRLATQGIQDVDPAYPLYPYQQTMVEKIQEMIATEGVSRAMLHLPTGAGKTRAAINVVCEHLRNNSKGLVLWLADTTELCGQAVDEFQEGWQCLGNRKMKLYSYYDDANISLGGIDGGFLVAGLQKIHSSRNSDENKILYQKLRDEVTLVVFDEAHKAIAQTYARTVDDMIGQLGSAFLLGLSATPGRKMSSEDGEDKRLSDFFNSNKVTMLVGGYNNPIEYLVENGYLASAEFIPIKYDTRQIIKSSSSKQGLNSQIFRELSVDDDRNIQLIKVISLEYDEGKSIIVFACSVDHARTLATLLAFRGIKAHSLDSEGDNSEQRRQKISEYSRGNVKVIINYNILTAGFDAPITSVAIIARPTDSLVQYSQMAGRAMRGPRSNGNSRCRIYTVRDDIPAFTSVANAFSHWDILWNEV